MYFFLLRYFFEENKKYVQKEDFENLKEILKNLGNLINEDNVQVENRRNLMDKQLEDIKISLNGCICNELT